MSVNRAVVVDPSLSERLVIRDVDYPTPASFEVLVRVQAISLNRGDVHTAFQAETKLGIWPASLNKGLLTAQSYKSEQEWSVYYFLVPGRRW